MTAERASQDVGLDKPSIQQVADFNTALGLATVYVVAHPPFGSYRADKLVGSIAGQLHRGHYAFAVRSGTIVGYFGWALCQPDVAEAWLEQGRTPSFDQCQSGEVLVPVMVVADDPAALRQLVAHVRKHHAGKTYMGRRASREANPIRRGSV